MIKQMKERAKKREKKCDKNLTHSRDRNLQAHKVSRVHQVTSESYLALLAQASRSFWASYKLFFLLHFLRSLARFCTNNIIQILAHYPLWY